MAEMALSVSILLQRVRLTTHSTGAANAPLSSLLYRPSLDGVAPPG